MAFFLWWIYAGRIRDEYGATRYFWNFGCSNWYNRCLLGWCFGQQIWLQILHQLYAWRSRYCDLSIFGLSRSEFYGIVLDPKSYTPDIIFYIAGGLLGFVSGPIQSASRTLLVFLADERQITENFGLYALVGRATAFLAPALITWFTLASGSQQIGLVPIIILLFIGWYLLRFVNVKKRV